MATGKVKFFNDAKGFGFITPSDNSKPIYVHGNDMNQPLRKGNNVSYTVEEGPRSLKAVDVSVLPDSSEDAL